MKIVFQHDHEIPVKKYGGIERILFWHMKTLARMGHHVILIGHPQSQVAHLGIELRPMQAGQDWRGLIPSDVDMVHLFYNHVPNPKYPTINTIQGNGKHGELFIPNSVFVSRNHAQNHGSEVFVYNGLDLEEYPFPAGKAQQSKCHWDHFLFLAKGSWKVKNLKGCVKACRRASKHLHIGGGRSFWPSRYIHSYGMVGGEEKLNLLKTSDVLLFPILWPEPFGIAIIEGMAMGLPVLGTPYGSLPELIKPETGLIIKSQAELTQAVHTAPRDFSPQVLRQYVEQHFTIEHFTRAYLELYAKIQRGESLNPKQPSYCLSQAAQMLMPF